VELQMDGFNHAASVSEVRQMVALKRDRVSGHYGLAGCRFLVGRSFYKAQHPFSFPLIPFSKVRTPSYTTNATGRLTLRHRFAIIIFGGHKLFPLPHSKGQL